VKAPVTWYVIADGQRAHIVTRRAEQSGYDLVLALDSAEAHRKSSELGSAAPGHVQESVGGARHGIEPKVDLHRKAKVDFAETVAGCVNEAATRQEFDRLVLVALAPTAAAVRNALAPGAAAKIAGELHKDLTKVPHAELAHHLAEVKLPASR